MGLGAVRAGLRLVRPAVPLGRGAPLPAPLRAGRRLLPPLPPAERTANGSPDGARQPEDLARLKASFPTPRDAVAYIMDTFPIVRRKDEEKYNGDYRTKRVILEIYDAMAEAIRTGQPYQTRLDPPPGPPGEPLPEWKPGQPKPANWPSHIHPPRGCRATPTDEWRLSDLADGAVATPDRSNWFLKSKRPATA